MLSRAYTQQTKCLVLNFHKTHGSLLSVSICIPYVGELATNKFARQIRRLIAKIASCVELRLVFQAAQKLSCLTRLKSKLNVLSRSGVVYQISCSQCEASYVGKTKRRLEQRIQEHSQQDYSSLYKHSSDLCHQIDYSRGDRGSLGHGVQWDSPYIGNSKKKNAIMTSSN